MININTKTTGFGSPAESYVDKRLDLNDIIPIDIMTTYYFKYAGDEKYGIKPNDILVVDRSLEPKPDDIVLIKSDKIFVEKYINQSNVWGTIIWILSQIKK
jgi:DNA polymerase V